MTLRDGLTKFVRCSEIAVCNVNAGVARCNREEGHDGPHAPHPSFYDAV